MEFNHIPVLLEEVIEGLNIDPNGIYLDGTLGGGGHSKEIIKQLENGKLIGVDQDKRALKAARENLKEFEEKLILVHSNYENIDHILDSLNIDKIDGVLLDIGVSSYQLDEASRGFSFHNDAPLDMRMDQTQKFSAWNVVNEYSERKLAQILWDYGEEKWADRIAKFIVDERNKKNIDSTLELVEVIKKAIPAAARRDSHPGRKTFQAIRIEVNRELDVLTNTIPKIINRLHTGGRLAIITFHSLEDRIVKNSFRDLFNDCICPSEIPICVCDKKREIEIITRKPIGPTSKELDINPRSRSAKLRVAEKL